MTRPELTDEDVRELIERARDATRALIHGDVRGYFDVGSCLGVGVGVTPCSQT